MRYLIIKGGVKVLSDPTIVSRGKGYETRNSAEFKGDNKGGTIYVEHTTTAHNLLFFDHTVWLNNLGQHFHWPGVRTKFKSYCGCARSRPQNGNKTSNKESYQVS